MKPFSNNFTLLRLVLALLVVFGHFKILQGKVYAGGIYGFADFAVDAFFIVSGYLIYASYDARPENISFYIRRFFRIYPLYFAVVLAQGVAMAVLAGGIVENIGKLAKYLGYNFIMANFMAHNLGGLLDHLHNDGVNPSLWTLKIEVMFYLIVPLLWWLTRRFGNTFLVLLYIASTLFAFVALYYDRYDIAKQLPGKLRFFAVGIALYCHRDAIKMRMPLTLGVLALCFAACLLRDISWLFPLYPLCVGMVVFLCAMRLPAITVSFDISYGVYLIHGPLIQLSLFTGIFADTYGFFTALVTTACILAFIAELAIEQPGINLGHRLSLLWLKRKEKNV